jgi:hypothetical protein
VTAITVDLPDEAHAQELARWLGEGAETGCGQDGAWVVSIRQATNRFEGIELLFAVQSWLSDQILKSVVVHVGDAAYTVATPEAAY